MIRSARTIVTIGAVTASILAIGCGNGSEVLQPQGLYEKSGKYAFIEGVTVEKGFPRAGVIVSAFDTGYIPFLMFKGQSANTVSDLSGKFSLVLLKGTAYNLLCIDMLSKSGAMLHCTPLSSEISLGNISLDSLGSIAGKLYGNFSPGNLYDVYLKGTPFFTTTGIDGAFTFTGIPSGEYSMVASMDTKNPNSLLQPAVVGSKVVSVKSGATAVDSIPID